MQPTGYMVGGGGIYIGGICIYGRYPVQRLLPCPAHRLAMAVLPSLPRQGGGSILTRHSAACPAQG